MIANHGWGKITNPVKWEKLGDAFSKYFGGILDFANPFFGLLAATGESICAILVLVGLYTQPAALLTAGTMFFAAMHHITTTGSPESAWVYFSIFTVIAMLGPGKYSFDEMVLKKK
jgi:putative oxidoreductase